MPNDDVYGGWPRSGEIDVIEMMGNKGYNCDGEERGRKCTASTLHWGPSWDQDPYEKTHEGKCLVEKDEDFSTEFNKFRLEWSEDGIQTYINDELVLNSSTPQNGFFEFGKPWNENSDNPWTDSSSNNAPFDQEFYLIINVAVGSTNGYMPDGCINDGSPKPWTDSEGGTASRSYYWGGENDINDLHLFNRSWTDPTFQIKEIKVWQNIESSAANNLSVVLLLVVCILFQ